MYEYLIAFFGLIIGGIIAYFTKDEWKQGRIYFVWGSRLLLLGVAVSFLILNFNWWMALIGLVIGFFIWYEYLFLGLGAGVLGLSLVFIYGLFKGTLDWFTEKKRMFWINALLFFIPLIIFYFIGLDMSSLAGGGCLGVLIKNLLGRFK